MCCLSSYGIASPFSDVFCTNVFSHFLACVWAFWQYILRARVFNFEVKFIIFFFYGFCFLHPKASNPRVQRFACPCNLKMNGFWLNLYALRWLSFATRTGTMQTSHVWRKRVRNVWIDAWCVPPSLSRVCPGRVTQWIDWEWVCEPGLDSQSGYMPGLRAGSPVGGTWEVTTLMFLSLSVSLPSSLKVN